MRYISTNDNLGEVIADHEKWVSTGGHDGSRADFSNAFLEGRDFGCTRLDNANFRGASLKHASFAGCSLVGATFEYADLRDAEFYEANLCKASFSNAKLEGVLCLETAWLRGADFRRAIGVPSLPMACPETGSFRAFKKCKISENWGRAIVELEIPARAKRSSANGRKCRASEAKVVRIYVEKDGKRINIRSAYSWWDPTFVYEVGKVVKPLHPFDEGRWDECASGIHFFMTRKEAEDYAI